MRLRLYHHFKARVHIETRLRRALIDGTLERNRFAPKMLLVLGNTNHFRKVVLRKSLAPVNVQVTTTDFAADAAIKWNPVGRVDIAPAIRDQLAGKRIVNGDLVDTAKDRVGRAFLAAFGYPLDVDPTTSSGLVVQKPVRNAAHGGEIIAAPIVTPLPDHVYSAVIDNVHDGYAEDIRVPIIGSSIPFCYLKYRAQRSRFKNVNKHVGMVGSRSVLQDEEIAGLRLFASILHLDYGELDVLRDRHTNRIYVVDANNTPYGPPIQMPALERRLALHLIGSSFVNEFMSQARPT